jgi:hypothetical protein
MSLLGFMGIVCIGIKYFLTLRGAEVFAELAKENKM